MHKKILYSKEYKEHHKFEDYSTISSIYFNDLYTEDTVGNFQMYRKCEMKVRVYTNEGTIPHFHLENSDNTFLCCICLKENKYFHHKDIDNKNMELSSK